jgi:predicted fused transcriptional regulator/phosphomethylpyrimidine kinase/predicted transcriptional regulator
MSRQLVKNVDVKLRLPCELINRYLLPKLRSELAKILVNKHGLSQLRVASILNVSQPAIHSYLNSDSPLKRNELESTSDEIQALAENLAIDIVDNKLIQTKALLSVCEFCVELRNDGPICQIHGKMIPKLAREYCDICVKDLGEIKRRSLKEQKILNNIRQAIQLLESSSTVTHVIPEIGMDIAMAKADAENFEDVASLEGGIHRVSDQPYATTTPEFGRKTHVGNAVLTAIKHDPSIRASMNIKYDPIVVDICVKLGLSISWFDRSKEPTEIKNEEGRTIPWGVHTAVERVSKMPDVIYDKGEVGKEPMILLFDSSAFNLAFLVQKIADEYFDQ